MKPLFTFTVVLLTIGAMVVCILWLFGFLGAWRQAPWEAILESLFGYLGVVASAIFVYRFAKAIVDTEPSGKSNLWPTWCYLRCVLTCAVIAYFVGAGLGKHVEDADPIRGGGEVVIDYEPTKKERVTTAVETFAYLVVVGLFGTGAGLKEVAAKRETQH
jgi:hypothetical protein